MYNKIINDFCFFFFLHKQKKNSIIPITIHNIFNIIKFNYVNINMGIQTIKTALQTCNNDRPGFFDKSLKGGGEALACPRRPHLKSFVPWMLLRYNPVQT